MYTLTIDTPDSSVVVTCKNKGAYDKVCSRFSEVLDILTTALPAVVASFSMPPSPGPQHDPSCPSYAAWTPMPKYPFGRTKKAAKKKTKKPSPSPLK